MNKFQILTLILLISGITSCNKSSREGNLTRFEADSIRYIAGGYQLLHNKEYDKAIALLDSTFLLPVKSPGQPDGLSVDEARRLMSYAVPLIMTAYAHKREMSEAHAYFTRLLHSGHPILSRYCRREIMVNDAQFLQALGRRAEACLMLDEAMALKENDDPSSELYCTIVAGTMYMTVDTTETRAEPTLLRAAEAMKNGAYDHSGFYPQAMVNLANIYIRRNDYQEGIRICREVLEKSDKTKHTQGMMRAAIALCGNFTELDLYDKALFYNDEGLRLSTHDMLTWGLAASLYERRALVYKRLGLTDSAFRALDRADSLYTKAINPRGHIRVRISKLDALTQFPDSLPGVLAGFEGIKDEVPGYMLLAYYMGYGRAMHAAGRYAEAIPLLEETIELTENREDLEDENHSNRLLLDCYHHTGRLKDARELLPRYNMIIDSVVHQKTIRESIASHIRFETEKVEQENRLLSTEVALKNSTIRIYGIAAIAVIFLILLLATWLRHRHRIASMRLKEKERELQRIIDSRHELHKRNQELARQLSEIQTSNPSDTGLNELIEALAPSMLTSEEEKEFRTAFSGIYPLALLHLREVCPGITKNEELLSMLILINQNTEDIARILGIATSSVARIRYRLRPKLNLPEKASLDEEIKKIMKGELKTIYS